MPISMEGKSMNQKAAEIAWKITMEHNRLFKALLPVVYSEDDEEYNTEKKRAFKLLYFWIMHVIDQPESALPEYAKTELAQILDEKLPDPRQRFETLRDVINFLTYREEVFGCGTQNATKENAHDEGSSNIHSRSDLGVNDRDEDNSRQGWLSRLWRRYNPRTRGKQ